MRKLIPAITVCLAVVVTTWMSTGNLLAAEKEAKAKSEPKESKWEEVKTASGKITSTTVQTGGGNNNNRNNNGKYANTSNYLVKPEYVEFDVTGNGMRVKYETKSTGDRPDLRIEVEKEIKKPNGDKDWQRVGLAGRARGETEGGKAFTSGAGKYRLELTGQNTEYKITVEQPIKKEPAAKN